MTKILPRKKIKLAETPRRKKNQDNLRKSSSGVCKINARESSPRFSKMGRPPLPPDFNVGLQRGARSGAVPRARKDERGQKQKRAFILQDQNTPFRETTTLKSGGKGVARRRGHKPHFRGPRTRLRAGHKVSGVYFANTGPPCALQTQNLCAPDTEPPQKTNLGKPGDAPGPRQAPGTSSASQAAGRREDSRGNGRAATTLQSTLQS